MRSHSSRAEPRGEYRAGGAYQPEEGQQVSRAVRLPPCLTI